LGSGWRGWQPATARGAVGWGGVVCACVCGCARGRARGMAWGRVSRVAGVVWVDWWVRVGILERGRGARVGACRATRAAWGCGAWRRWGPVVDLSARLGGGLGAGER
jgi:hypothetical protein